MLRKGSIAQQVQEKFGTTLKWYCNKKVLPYHSLLVGYVTKESKEVLAADGIFVEVTKEIKNNKEVA